MIYLNLCYYLFCLSQNTNMPTARKFDVLVYVHIYVLCIAILHVYVRILKCIYLTSVTCSICMTIMY